MTAEPKTKIEAIVSPAGTVMAHWRGLLHAALFTFPYVCMSAWFTAADVYNRYFSTPSPVYIVYNTWKIVFVLYFTWLLYWVGRTIVNAVEYNVVPFQLKPLERAIVAFYSGAAVVGVIMYFLGACHLYYRSLALAATAPVIFFSYPEFRRSWHTARRWWNISPWDQATLLQQVLVEIIIIMLLLVLLVRALAPTIDWDVLTHYIQYYNLVMRNHGTSPNVVWYHYYYSKGAGLMFLGMLLADDSALKLVTFCMVLGTVGITYILGSTVTRNSSWGLTVTIVYLCSLLTEPHDYMESVFDKQHILMQSLFAFVVFGACRLSSIKPASRWRWVFLWSLAIVHLALFVPTAIAFLWCFLLAASIYYLLARGGRRSLFRFYAFATVVATVVSVGICVQSYVQTGMIGIDPMRLTWAWANQKRFSNWCSAYMPVYTSEGSNRSMGTLTVHKDMSTSMWFSNLLHIEWVQFLLPSLSVPVFLLLSIGRRNPAWQRTWRTLGPVFGIIISAACASLLYNQPISCFRYFVFVIPLLALSCVSIWFLFVSSIYPAGADFGALIISGAAIINLAILPDRARPQPPSVSEQLRFVTGRMSFQDAYKTAGIGWPELVFAKQNIGIEERILSLNLAEGLGAIPGRCVESEINCSYREWHKMVFGPPAVARAAFYREGIRFVAIDFHRRLSGGLPYSPLFSSEEVAKYFDLLYQWNTTYVLTWKGTNGRAEPLPPDLVANFARIAESSEACPALYQRVKLYYDRNQGAAYPVNSDRSLRPVQGWQ